MKNNKKTIWDKIVLMPEGDFYPYDERIHTEENIIYELSKPDNLKLTKLKKKIAAVIFGGMIGLGVASLFVVAPEAAICLFLINIFYWSIYTLWV